MDSFVSIENASLTFRRWHNPTPQLKEAVVAKLNRQKTRSEAETFECLKSVNLRINAGDRLGIVGLNGAGKSTMLKMIVGIYTPTTGCVRVNGHVTPLIELGTGFDPELSGRENIYLNGSMLGRSYKQMQAHEEEIIEFSELRDFIDQPIKYYSSGMHGRLAFSIATSLNPQILLIDEIFSTGDAHFVGKAQARMQSLLDNSQIFVLVTHNMEQIKEFCNRAVFLHKGEIVHEGEPAEVVDYYLETIGKPSKPRKKSEAAPLSVTIAGPQAAEFTNLQEVIRVIKDENKNLRGKLKDLHSDDKNVLLDEYLQIRGAIERRMFDVKQPLLLISQAQRSGGNFFNTLLDGHSELHVHPYELGIGHPDKTTWPQLDLKASPQQWFALLKESAMVHAFWNGYARAEIDNPHSKGKLPFVLPPNVHEKLFEHLCNENKPTTQREVINAYMTAFFNAWMDYRSEENPRKKFVSAYVARLGQTGDSLDRFFEDYPDGYFLSIIRDPRSWLVSARKHSSSHIALDVWERSSQAMLAARARHGERVKIICFEDLILRTEKTMQSFCESIGIKYDECLLSPTFNKIAVPADSEFFCDQYAISRESVEQRRHLLTQSDLKSVEDRAMPIYEKALTLAV